MRWFGGSLFGGASVLLGGRGLSSINRREETLVGNSAGLGGQGGNPGLGLIAARVGTVLGSSCAGQQVLCDRRSGCCGAVGSAVSYRGTRPTLGMEVLMPGIFGRVRVAVWLCRRPSSDARVGSALRREASILC